MGMIRRRIYDGKKLWGRFMTWGAAATYKKLREWATSEGMVTPGKARASHMGPFWAMWNYAFKNPEEAFPLYREWWYETDPLHRTPSFDEFISEIKRRAVNPEISSPKAYEKFVQKYPSKQPDTKNEEVSEPTC